MNSHLRDSRVGFHPLCCAVIKTTTTVTPDFGGSLATCQVLFQVLCTYSLVYLILIQLHEGDTAPIPILSVDAQRHAGPRSLSWWVPGLGFGPGRSLAQCLCPSIQLRAAPSPPL